MLLAGLAILAGAAAGWFSGRRPPLDDPGRRLRALRPVLLATAVALVAIGRWTAGSAGLALMICGYALMIGFVILNAGHPGLLLVGLGLLANATVMLADGGMPVAGRPAGVPAAGHHHGLSTRDHLTGLSDQIRLAPLGQTVSAGDIAVSVGVAVAVFGWLGPREPGRPRTGGRRPGRRTLGRRRPGRRPPVPSEPVAGRGPA
jgi:hypothetical protein